MQEYADLNLSANDFFKFNFRARNIVVNSLGIISLFHPRWKKITMLMTEIALILLSNSVFLTLNEKVTHSSIQRILIFAIISTCAADLVLYLISFFFVFPPFKIRKLLYLIKGNGDLIILKEWEKISYIQGYKALIGYFICLYILGFIFLCYFWFYCCMEISKYCILCLFSFKLYF